MRRLLILFGIVTSCVLTLSLAGDDTKYSLETDPLPRDALELLKGLSEKDVIFIKRVAIRLLQNDSKSSVMDKIRVKFPETYEKAEKIAQILKMKIDKLTPESRAFVMEVIHKSTVTPSFFAHESELTNEQTVEVVKRWLKLSKESKGYIRAYFARMDSLIWKVINRYYVRGAEKELRN